MADQTRHASTYLETWFYLNEWVMPKSVNRDINCLGDTADFPLFSVYTNGLMRFKNASSGDFYLKEWHNSSSLNREFMKPYCLES